MDEEVKTTDQIETGNEQEMRQPGNLIAEHPARIAPILGILLIILVLILGGLYLWGASLSEESTESAYRTIPNNEPETPRAEADVEILSTVSSSDSLDALEADIESTNIDTLDAEFTEVENEMRAVLGE